MVYGLGLKVQDVGFRVRIWGFRLWGSRVWGLGAELDGEYIGLYGVLAWAPK